MIWNRVRNSSWSERLEVTAFLLLLAGTSVFLAWIGGWIVGALLVPGAVFAGAIPAAWAASVMEIDEKYSRKTFWVYLIGSACLLLGGAIAVVFWLSSSASG